MRLAEALIILQSAPPESRSSKIALLCGFTPLHLETFFRAQLIKLDPEHYPSVQTGLYGDLISNLRQLANSSGAVVVIEWPDLDPRLGLRRVGGWEPSKLPQILDNVNRACDCLQSAIETLARDVPVVLSFPTLRLVPLSLSRLLSYRVCTIWTFAVA